MKNKCGIGRHGGVPESGQGEHDEGDPHVRNGGVGGRADSAGRNDACKKQ